MNEPQPVPKPEKKNVAEPKQSAADKYRALLAEANKHRDNAVNELKSSIEALIGELNELGFNFRLAEGGEVSGGKKSRTPRKASGRCDICQFETTPYHDGRNKFHRAQPEGEKKPLTAKQMADSGLTKVA